MAILIETSRQDLSNDMIFWKFIFENNLITLLSRFVPKTCTWLHKTLNIFFCMSVCVWCFIFA